MSLKAPWFTCVLLVSLALASECTAADFILGIGSHIYGQEPARNIQAIKESGATSFRDDLLWSMVEADKNLFLIPAAMERYLALAAKQGVDPLLILDYGNKFYDNGGKPISKESLAAFERYASYSLHKVAGKHIIVEIWNEWDNSKDPKSAESYFELIKSVAPTIRAANKGATILAGAATSGGIRKGWVEKLVKLGVLKFVDGISLHPYIHCERDKSPEAWINFVSDTSNSLRASNGGKAVPLYITEMGWPSNNGACGTAPDTVANYLARALLLVRTCQEVKGLWWYDLMDDGNNLEEREHNFGLLTSRFVPKPALTAFRDVAPYVKKASTVVRQPAPGGVVSLLITGTDGMKSLALWTENERSRRVRVAFTRQRNTSTRVLAIGTGKPLSIEGSNYLDLNISGRPQIISGISNHSVQW